MKQMKTGILASVATSFLMCALGAAAAGFDGRPLTTNDWFDANFTALTADTPIVQGGTLGITRGAGSWTAVPATGTAVIAADADAGGAATMLSIAAPDEELTFTPATLAATSGLETVSAEMKADAIDALPEIGADVQAAFTVYLDENDVLSAQGWTAAGWTNLASAAADSLTNAWFTLYVDLATVGGVRYVRYSVKPAASALAVLADAGGTTWFQAGRNADVVSSVSFSGIGSVRTFAGDELESLGVAMYDGVPYQTFEAAVAAGVADGWTSGSVTLFEDATWTPTTTGSYNIDVNGYELTVEGVVYTVSGTTYSVTGFNYYWIGGASGNWADGSWSRTAGGEPLSGVPGSADRAVFTSAAIVNLTGSSNVGCLQLDGDVTFTGNNQIVINAADGGSTAADAGVVSGAGALALSNATLRVHSARVVITNEIVIASASTNHLMCTSATGNLYAFGGLSGGGTVYCDQSSSGSNGGGVRLYGDTSSFTGSMYFIATNQRPTNYLADSPALNNANSSWFIETGAGREGQTFDGSGSSYTTYFPLRVGSATYHFGALYGYIPYAKGTSGWLTGVNLKVGYLNSDCWLSGNWNGVTASGLEWCASDATMQYAVTNTAFVTIDSGTVELTGMGIFRSNAAVTFAGSGATLAFASGVDYDVSQYLSDASTSAVCVDVEDNDITWATQLTDSNVPNGLTKKGSGTLTLSAEPTYSGATVIKAGELVVPQGTTIAELSLDGGRLTVPLTGAEDDTTILSITALAEGTGYDALTNAVAIPGATMTVTSDGGSGYIVKATRNPQTFTWTGAADTAWENAANWTVGGVVASTAPLAVDTALFPVGLGDKTNVVLSARATVAEVVADADVAFSGAQICSPMYRGDGKLVLGDGAGFYLNAKTDISNNLEIVGAVTMTPSTTYINTYIYGNLTGDGTVTFGGQRPNYVLSGDNSEFKGTISAPKDTNDRNGIQLAAESAASTNAIWNVYSSGAGNFTKGNGATFKFGSLNGAVQYADQSNYKYQTIEVGHLGLDGALGGTWFPSTYKDLVVDSNLSDRTDNSNRGHCLRKVGDGTLTFSGRYLRKFEMNGGTLLITNDESFVWTKDETTYRSRFTFGGGTLAFGEGVTGDPSSRIVGSAAPICFSNAVGEVHTWATALDASNVGGLVKKGEGTLILSAKPAYTGTTYLECGTLKMPVRARVRTHQEGKYVVRSSETVGGVTYTVFTLADGEPPPPTVLLLK